MGRLLKSQALHRTITGIRVLDARVLDSITVEELRRRITGAKVSQVSRHGKHLFAELDRGTVLTLHFGMTGRLAYGETGLAALRFARLIIYFTSLEVAFIDQRIFGRVGAAESAEKFVAEHGLGPDALKAGPAELRRAMRTRRGVKSVFLDQSRLAGIGNLYADEILFQSGIHPQRPAAELTDRQLRTLHRIMNRVLRKSIELLLSRRSFPAEWLIQRRYPKERCPRCRGTISVEKIAGRTTYFCSRHQRMRQRSGV